MPNGCLEWTRARTPNGYGVIRKDGKNYYIHRMIAWLIGIIPSLDSVSQILHSCDNQSCFEPSHLKAGNDSNNIKEAWDRGRRRRVVSHIRRG